MGGMRLRRLLAARLVRSTAVFLSLNLGIRALRVET